MGLKNIVRVKATVLPYAGINLIILIISKISSLEFMLQIVTIAKENFSEQFV